jgi:hypothetical protein
MNETPLDAWASVQLIDAMINRARNRFSENGHLYLLWGWVVLACSLSHYLLQHQLGYPRYYLVWMGTWLAVAYQTVYLARKKSLQTVRTYTDDILKYVWLVFAIVTALSTIIVSALSGKPDLSTPVFLVMYGMPTFLSGIILKQRSLLLGSVCCWLLSLATLWVAPRYHMLLISVAVVVAWIVPGYLLQSNYKRAQQGQKP